MTKAKRKKSMRQRAGTTHGYGSMKKNRGAGNRGGVGKAGSGKRGDAKKPADWKKKKYFGMYGFKPKGKKLEITTANVSDISSYALKAGGNKVNLADFGINKLLGNGKVNAAYDITVDYASKKAVQKIQDAKGSVNVLVGGSEEAPAEDVPAEAVEPKETKSE